MNAILGIALVKTNNPGRPVIQVTDDGLWYDDSYFVSDDGNWHDDSYFSEDDGLWHDDIYF